MLEKLMTNFDLWALVGLAAQIAFASRFLVQWIASERCGRSIVPVSFWYLSIFGSAGLLVYATIRGDPVFMLGQATGSFIYARNLVLVYREKRSTAQNGGEVTGVREKA